MPRNKTLKQVVGENLRAVIAARKLSQPQVAALAKQRGHNIDQTTVGRIARAAMPTTVDTLDALGAALGLEPWQLLVPDLNPARPPRLGAALAPDETELLKYYTTATGRWKLALRHMAALREDNEQEEVASGMNILMAEILGRRPYPVAKMGPGWDKPTAVHQPKGKYQKTKV